MRKKEPHLTVDKMFLVFYIIGCTIMTIACIYKFTSPAPKNTKEAMHDSFVVLILVVFWPGIIVIYFLSIALQWISGDL